MNETARTLCAISANKPTTLRNFLISFGDDRPPWDTLHSALTALEQQELIVIQRHGGVIATLQLTELGSERAREAMQEQPS